jgi:hypothetical protein
MWNRAKTVLSTMVLIAASLTIYFAIYLKTHASAFTPSSAPITGLVPPVIISEEGQEVSLDQAQAHVPYKIRLPANMGTFVEIRLLDEIDRVIIVYAAEKPSNRTTVDDVLNQNGIVLLELPNDMTLQEAAQNILAGIDSVNANTPGNYAQQVSINGYVGEAGGNVRHCLSWYTETTYYRLIANVNCPLQQLVEIAQNIPIE